MTLNPMLGTHPHHDRKEHLMRKTAALTALTLTLVLAPATGALADEPAHAGASVVAQDTVDQNQESDKTGLWGLLGLLGLAGLIKRKTEETSTSQHR